MIYWPISFFFLHNPIPLIWLLNSFMCCMYFINTEQDMYPLVYTLYKFMKDIFDVSVLQFLVTYWPTFKPVPIFCAKTMLTGNIGLPVYWSGYNLNLNEVFLGDV